MTDQELTQAIGANLRAARSAAGKTQEQLAEVSGIEKPNISRVESGEHLPSLRTLNRLARALNVSLSVLVQPLQAPAPVKS